MSAVITPEAILAMDFPRHKLLIYALTFQTIFYWKSYRYV